MAKIIKNYKCNRFAYDTDTAILSFERNRDIDHTFIPLTNTKENAINLLNSFINSLNNPIITNINLEIVRQCEGTYSDYGEDFDDDYYKSFRKMCVCEGKVDENCTIIPNTKLKHVTLFSDYEEDDNKEKHWILDSGFLCIEINNQIINSFTYEDYGYGFESDDENREFLKILADKLIDFRNNIEASETESR